MDSEIVIPDKYNGLDVTSIGNNAFTQMYNIKSITIPSSILSIGEKAFYYCVNLNRVIFKGESGLTSIGEGAFAFCFNLTGIIIPKNVINIAENTFFSCFKLVELYNLSKLDILLESSDNGYIGYYAFEECSNLIINCEAESKPAEWDDEWNPNGLTVNWGIKF